MRIRGRDRWAAFMRHTQQEVSDFTAHAHHPIRAEGETAEGQVTVFINISASRCITSPSPAYLRSQ
ncbi:hypothetical protein E2C01_026316 [Portunus trituberculatus]|uniref:Uncharacterized protein n=1 Tax=Portunus trituberculatus TaxID=210409 RepID=A0A5B7EHY5_PORTR|nr:hypothetical protein [Portunus trituberculatus]